MIKNILHNYSFLLSKQNYKVFLKNLVQICLCIKSPSKIFKEYIRRLL